jgi:hypothetical protein
MNDNTILRIRVPKHLYESVKRELTLKEGKQNLGAGMTPVKEKKSSSDAPKKTTAPKKANAPVKVTADNAVKADKETDKMGASMTEKKTPKDGHKKMGLDELKALAEMLKGQIEEMEAKDKEKVEEKEEKDGEEKKEKVEEKKAEHEDKDELKEWNPYDRDEPDEYDPQDYDTSYARSGGRGMSRRDVRRKLSGLYSDDEIAAAQQADAIKAGRISAPAPNQTPREKF